MTRNAAILVLWTVLGSPAAAQDEPLGRRAAFEPLEAEASILVPADTPLRTHPDPRAAQLAIVSAEIELPVLERDGIWIRTRFRELTGWLAPAGEPVPDASKPLAPEARALIVVDRAAEERTARLAQARARLQGENRVWTTLGPWPLHTDVEDEKLLSSLDRIATSLPATYRERFGLEPDISRLPPILLFEREKDYRDLTWAATNVGDFAADGHADSSLAALFVEASSRDELASILVHELTHLLNRQVFPLLPRTWLEEGLANDLSLSRIGADGRLEPGTLGGTTLLTTQRMRGNTVAVSSTSSGGRVVWTKLLQDWKTARSRMLPLGELLDLEWIDFVAPDQRSRNYALSTFLVRFLLDAAPEETAMDFRAFLEDVAAGGPSGAAALGRGLGQSVDKLERSYGFWLTSEVGRAQ